VWATAASAAEIDPPPPPPAPGMPRPAAAPASAPTAVHGEPTALDRYQDCFQKMIDVGATDNVFMRHCLGIPDRPARRHPGADGRLDELRPGDVAAVVKKGLPGLEECYDKLLQASHALGFTPEGAVDPHFAVTSAGQVESVAFAATSMTDVSLLTCMRERIKSWTFPRTNYGDRLAVRLSLRLKAKTNVKSETASVTLRRGFPRLSGLGYGLSPADVLTIFRQNAPHVRACYNELVKRKPHAGGRAAVDLIVSAAGRVSRVSYREFTLDDASFKSCMTAQLKHWRFPRPLSGESTTVRYPPFVFQPR